MAKDIYISIKIHKVMHKQFIEKDASLMLFKYMRGCFCSFTIREMQFESTLRFQFSSTENIIKLAAHCIGV